MVPDYQDRFLDLPFKAARSYLHSTDIYPALVELVQNQFGRRALVESLTLRRPFTHGVLVSFQPSQASSGAFRVRHGTETVSGWLLETEIPIARRSPSDLPDVSAFVVAGPGFARILNPLPRQAPLDVLVSLMKLVADQVERRHWWLCRLDLDVPLTTAYPLEIQIRHILGRQCIVFNILQVNLAVGSARFMADGTNS